MEIVETEISLFKRILRDFLTKFTSLNSSEDQGPAFTVPAGQINPRTSEEDLHYFPIALLDSVHDRRVCFEIETTNWRKFATFVLKVPAVKSFLSSEILHRLWFTSKPASCPHSYLGQSLPILSSDIVVNVWLLHYDVHNV